MQSTWCSVGRMARLTRAAHMHTGSVAVGVSFLGPLSIVPEPEKTAVAGSIMGILDVGFVYISYHLRSLLFLHDLMLPMRSCLLTVIAPTCPEPLTPSKHCLRISTPNSGDYSVRTSAWSSCARRVVMPIMRDRRCLTLRSRQIHCVRICPVKH